MVYFEDGRVAEFLVEIGPLGSASWADVDPEFAIEFFVELARMPYDGSDPDAAEAFVRENADNEACETLGCEIIIGPVQFWMDGTRWGWPNQLSVYGLEPTFECTIAVDPTTVTVGDEFVVSGNFGVGAEIHLVPGQSQSIPSAMRWWVTNLTVAQAALEAGGRRPGIAAAPVCSPSCRKAS